MCRAGESVPAWPRRVARAWIAVRMRVPAPCRTGPVSTYRVQLTPDFGFARWRRSPPICGTWGSATSTCRRSCRRRPARHGYDVTRPLPDPARSSAAPRGSASDGRATLAAHGSGHRPRHRAQPHDDPGAGVGNAQFWSVLKDGPASPYAVLVRHRLGRRAGGAAGARVTTREPVRRRRRAALPRARVPHPDGALPAGRLASRGPGYRRFFDVSR